MRTANGSVEIFVVFVALDIWMTCGNEHACVTVQVVHVECFFCVLLQCKHDFFVVVVVTTLEFSYK